MIARVMNDERTRQAARKARRAYAVASGVLMLVLTFWGAAKVLQWATS